MAEYWEQKTYATAKEARLGVMAAGYPMSLVEIYTTGKRLIEYHFRLNEAGLADQAASRAEILPRKKLPRVERKRLNEPTSPATRRRLLNE